jgi:hypothetical protein
VLVHERRRPLPVAGDDRVPHQPVEQVRPLGLGAVELAEGLEDQRHVDGALQQPAQPLVPGRGQDGPVELVVRRVDGPGQLDRVRVPGVQRGLEGGDPGVEEADLLVRDPFGRQFGGVRLEAGAQAVQVGHVLDRQPAHHGSPVRLAVHEPLGLEAAQGLADRRAGERELLGDALLDQALARSVAPLDDGLPDVGVGRLAVPLVRRHSSRRLFAVGG